ncbi:winged helix-turn-helix domain-containing protein [Methanolobus sp. ZRKC2]|uniref:helix-turn-helix transcriptional regulator n=1 Tax=Methanolobus sp. ZRKC2 TaxID=3125783 RepID=UPI0032446537
MKKPILDIIFASEKRKNMLLLLQDGPKEMETILRTLETTRQALLPQIRIMEEHHLIVHYDDAYKLTMPGKLIVNKMIPLVNTCRSLNKNIDFFASHNIDPIPSHIFERINEIRNCEIIEPSLVDIFEMNKDFVEEAYNSSSLSFLLAFSHPAFSEVIARLAEGDKNTSIIVNEEIFDKFKSEWYEEFKHYLACENVKFYLYRKDLELTCLSICERSFVLRLLSKNNKFSNKHLYCKDTGGHQWSKDFFDYYLKDAELITEI